ncbi:MAG: helix-turn-helix domain-containing protein [Acidimicrobiales bacterium]
MAGAPSPLEGLVGRPVGYQLRVPAGSIHQGLPSGTATLIVNLDAPMRVRWPGEPSRRFQVLLGGLHTSPAEVITEGRQFGIQLALSPAGVRTLFGLPIGALANCLVDPADVLDGRSRARRDLCADLAERLAARPTWSERYAELDRLLAGIAGVQPPPSPLAGAWQRVRSTGGRVPVGRLASEVGMGRRQLTERFRREYGITVKQAFRLTRFEHARRVAARRGLAAAAAEAGYSDQAHLSRDWRQLGGRTPRPAARRAVLRAAGAPKCSRPGPGALTRSGDDNTAVRSDHPR